ncbi:MAG: glucosyltransferase I RfaG [Desulfuromonas sp.]|nr:MAG: glucosyltransferase I RfaG [Desulfuromonas sp.]
MKLAFALFKYFPYGGLQRDCVRIAQECQSRGHHVDIFALESHGDLPESLTVTCLPVTSKINYRRYEQFASQLLSLVASEGYDALVGFNKMPGLDVYYAADPCYANKAQQRSLLYRLLPRTRSFLEAERRVFAPDATTEILLISPAEQKIFAEVYRTPTERMHLLPPGIHKDRIAGADYQQRRQATRSQLGLSDEQTMLLMVGSGFKTKGMDRSLHALASLPDSLRSEAHLYVVGQDNFRPFAAMSRRLGVEDLVHFLGGRNDVPDLLFAADILLHPAYRENTGTVLLEAIVAGLPQVVTDVCGYAFYVEQSQCGTVLNSPFEQQQMNHALLNLMTSADISVLKENARRYIQSQDLFSMPQRAVDVIEGKPL